MNYTNIHKTSIINGERKIISSKDSNVIIGKYCAIAPGLKIITLNHDYNYPCLQGTFYKDKFKCNHPGITQNPPNKERTKGHTIIGNDVWIGEDVFIGSGITIGDGCCVGAKSVVTKSLPPYSICVGCPCKPIKLRFSQDIINYLLEIQWWNWDKLKIEKNKEFFMSNLSSTNINTLKNIIVN